jgi:tRNA-specific 2-thiouridylase
MKETNWLGDHASIEDAAAVGLEVLARVRSTRDPSPARLVMRGGAPGLVFDSPEEGVAPGQACVLYDAVLPSRVLGGGFIAATERAELYSAASLNSGEIAGASASA